ncbi:serine/threonine-protein kinase mos-like [Tubulanus polymorphus]|uniref:serine/threonine-protein kinase mos-like n=1 Tax=Tubulanus polymorphus TaxID=672921 RepID=UPI003DA64AD0
MTFFDLVDQIFRQFDFYACNKERTISEISPRRKWRSVLLKCYRQIKKPKQHMLYLHFFMLKTKRIECEIGDPLKLSTNPTNLRENLRRSNHFQPDENLTPNAEQTLSCHMQLQRRLSEKIGLEFMGRSIRKDDIIIERLVGTGGFGAVYEGWTAGGCRVAVKRMHLCMKNKQAQLESYRAELNILTVKHRNIVRTIAAIDPLDGEPFLLMEYAGEFNLQQAINDQSYCLPAEKRLRFASNIADALKFVHDMFIVHLDVKPSNIMISSEEVCKLGDFGCCQLIGGKTNQCRRSQLTGTFAYRAPELLRGDSPTSLADIYSFGITLWEMLTRERPYGAENPHVVIFGVVAYGLRPALPVKINLEMDPFESCYHELFTQCWEPDIDERPSSSEVKIILDTWKKIEFES